MTATTTTRSAYPREVPELIPHARDLAAEIGEVPSRNRLMKTFKVGADKAKALREALTTAEPAEPAAPVAPESVDPLTRADYFPPGYLNYQPSETAPGPAEAVTEAAETPAPTAEPDAGAVAEPAPVVRPARRPVTWPVLILCLPAFVAIWGGWVEMGRLTGFGMVTLLPGVSDFQLDTSITLPIGVETYAAFALYVWLSGRVAADALRFAKWSALASLALGAAGQVAYHLMAAAGWTSAPWPITAAVSCIPVAVLGMGAALAHLMHRSH